MKISLVIVTHNRKDVLPFIEEHWKRAGRPVDEVVWADNGSTDGMADCARAKSPEVLILNKQNQFYDRAYNQCCVMATGDWICNSGSPDYVGDHDWLKAMCDVAESGEVDMVSIWSCDYGSAKERHTSGEPRTINGRACAPGIPFEVHMFRRSMLSVVGYMRQDFGQYGWTDCEFADRVRRTGVRCVVLTDFRVRRNAHLLSPTNVQYNGEIIEVSEWKRREVSNPHKMAMLNKCRAEGFQYYNPFTP